MQSRPVRGVDGEEADAYPKYTTTIRVCLVPKPCCCARA